MKQNNAKPPHMSAQGLAKNISQIPGELMPEDPWNYLALAVVARAVADMWKMDEKGVNKFTTTGRNSFHVYRNEVEEFLRGDWCAFLISETEYTQKEILRAAGIKEEE